MNNKNNYFKFFGDWGLGIGDWGLGVLGWWAKTQNPKPKKKNKNKKKIFFIKNI